MRNYRFLSNLAIVQTIFFNQLIPIYSNNATNFYYFNSAPCFRTTQIVYIYMATINYCDVTPPCVFAYLLLALADEYLSSVNAGMAGNG